jgi:O-methyltransferase domain
MPHDFFTPQSSWSNLSSKPELYFIRLTLHNWSDDQCVQILSQIRGSILPAEQGGRLYIAECIMDEDTDRFKYMISMHMMTLTGTLERTEDEFGEMLRRSGFKLEAVHRNRGFLALIEAVAC